MNKQELIDKYTAEIAKLRPYCPNRNLISEQLKYDLYKEILDDLEQLDEPQKHVMPKFFDDWAKRVIAKHDKFYAISLVARAGWGYGVDFELSENGSSSENKELLYWIVDECSDNYPNKKKAIEALLYGYEVEKEPLYCVKIGKGYFSGFDETKVTYVIDDAPGALAQRVKYETREEAEMDAIQIGGTVEEVAE